MDQRTCIKLCVKNEIKCADAFRMLTVAYGEATLDRSNVYRWYKMFSEGREDVNDEERAGRPSTSTTDEKINEVEKMILANRRITVREVAEDLNISIGSCHSIFINDLGMRRVAAKFVPKLLNCDQKQHRMNIANEMLDSVRDDPNLLQRVITGDEAWVYGYDVETKAQSSQWKLPPESRSKKSRQVRSNVNVLLTGFFDCRGVVHHEFLPQGRTVNKEYYLQVMRNMREAIRQKRPDLWKNKNWLLHHDNAPAHTSLLVRDFLAKNNTLMMPQPPYTPDLAPCDFFLFPKLKRPMKGRRYATLDEIKTASKEELKRFLKNDFLKCFEDWKNRWHKCIISHGDYFEGDKIGMLHTTLVPIDLESSGEFIFIRYHDFCNMGGERLTFQVEQTIRTLSKEGNSYSVIVKKLKAEGLDVGKATICRVVNGIGKKREAESNGQKFQIDRPRPVRTPATVSKVKRLATTENPPSQRQLSRMCGTSLKTINNIIHKDLELDTRRKGKVHKLTPFHMKNRATNARKLYEEHLAGSRSEYTATLDEAWMYVTYCNGIRKICYIKRGNQVPDNWVHQCSETFPKGFMVVGVMTGRGVLPLIKVPSKVKVNSEFYIECVLKPVIEQLKDLYPGEMDKVFLHHDKASSHTSNKTQQFLQEMKDTLGLNFIRNSDIPVKSPDASPLDFYGFGMLKQRLFNRRPKTEAGLWKAAQEEWSNVSLSKVKEVFAAWKVRCREIAKKKGKHIEHMKKIHVRKIKF
ncbi:hypothetical protein LAZ67_13002655 [Cordylochernes scorpioides]|uniref:Transposase n=1 Tax=Cordylochernes scorpioides TaxID=51811 RepID=A0ABY6L4P8_9ARAC|nr:hypothetical protein LAZ67_13002655 [Cordylochernes scorpioides]